MLMTSFDSLKLRAELIEALAWIDYTETTPIQAAALPVMLRGHDVTGQAKTGSGKTAAFGLALLNTVRSDENETQSLVLCPTRELADQVAAELRRLARKMSNTRVLVLCGGRPIRTQTLALAHGNHIVVGTPGRVGQLVRKGKLDLRALKVLVLDEADRMLDMGFSEQVIEIVERCPADRQTLLFSATLDDTIEAFSHQVQRQPRRVSVESQATPDRLVQKVFECGMGSRRQLLVDVLAKFRPSAALLFCETRNDCDAVAAFLNERGAVALALHGQMEQRDRDETLIQFGHQSASILVATNVAARGIDIPALPMVVVTELSKDPESHLHRVGRTGRAGQEGIAISLVEPREENRLRRVESFLGVSLERDSAPRFEGRLDFLAPPNRTLILMAGRKDKLRKGDILGALVKDAGLPPDAVGRIDLMPRRCAVSVSRDFAQQALRHFQTGRVKRRQIRACLLSVSRRGWGGSA